MFSLFAGLAFKKSVATGSSRMKREWIEKRYLLPLQRPTYDNKTEEMLDTDCTCGPKYEDYADDDARDFR